MWQWTNRVWRWASRTAEDEAPEDGGTSSRIKRNPELEAVIEKEPDNIEAYLVYGDWLQAQGDPRGELIALQCAAHQATGEEAAKFKEQASALVREHKQLLLGELADQEDFKVKVEWRFGFIRSARLAQSNDKNTFDTKFNVAEAVGLFMALPSTRFLRELTFGVVNFDDCGLNNDYSGVVEALARTPCPTLERLFIGDSIGDEYYMMYTATFLKDISPLYKAHPQLRALKLVGNALELGEVDLPELRECTVESNALTPQALQSIVKAKWPKLERLEVWFGNRTYDYVKDDLGEPLYEPLYENDLQPLLEGKGLPALKHLGLCAAAFVHRLCAVLPHAKLLPQLESLDLSKGTLMDEEAVVLSRHAAAFKHLKHLDVTQNLLSSEGEQLLSTLCASVATGNQRDPSDDDNVDPDEDDRRYADVGE